MAQARRTFFSLGGPTYMDDPRAREAEAAAAGRRDQQRLAMQGQQLQRQFMLEQQKLELERTKLGPEAALAPERLALEQQRLAHQREMDPIRFQIEREKLRGGGMEERKMALLERKADDDQARALAQLGLSREQLNQTMAIFKQGEQTKKSIQDALLGFRREDAEAQRGVQRLGIETGAATTLAGHKATTARHKLGIGAQLSEGAAGRGSREDIAAAALAGGLAGQEIGIEATQERDVLQAEVRKAAAVALLAGQKELGTQRGGQATALAAQAAKDSQALALQRGKIAALAAKNAHAARRDLQREDSKTRREVQERTIEAEGFERAEDRALQEKLAEAKSRAQAKMAIEAAGNAKERLKLEDKKFEEDVYRWDKKYAEDVRRYEQKARKDYSAKQAETEQFMLGRVGEFRKYMKADPTKRDLVVRARALLEEAAAADRSLGNFDKSGRPIPSGIYRFTRRQIEMQAGKELMAKAEPGVLAKVWASWPNTLNRAGWEKGRKLWKWLPTFGHAPSAQTGDEEILEALSEQPTPGY